MVEHDNELLNHRIQWFLTINGFLFTAIAIYGIQVGRGWFGGLLAFVAILICISFRVALRLGGNGWARINLIWSAYREAYDLKGHFASVGIYGYKAPWSMIRFAPWRVLPEIMIVAWVGIAIFGVVAESRGWRPTGSYASVVVKPGEQAIWVIDTATGKGKVIRP